MSDNEFDILDVYVDSQTILDQLKKKTTEELISVIMHMPDKVEFGVDVKHLIRRFFNRGKLSGEDRKLLEYSVSMVYTKYTLED